MSMQIIIGYSISSKVCHPRHIEPIQLWANIVGLILRGTGSITGAMLSINDSAYLCLVGGAFSAAGFLAFYRRLGHHL